MNKTKWTHYLALLLTTLVAGCATAYHCYSGCRIDCRYCPPPPLPYSDYAGCACHSRAVSRYLTVPAQSIQLQTDDEIDGDEREGISR
jgi:hypothetical protein